MTAEVTIVYQTKRTDMVGLVALPLSPVPHLRAQQHAFHFWAKNEVRRLCFVLEYVLC
jgi:hypothetical protein